MNLDNLRTAIRNAELTDMQAILVSTEYFYLTDIHSKNTARFCFFTACVSCSEASCSTGCSGGTCMHGCSGNACAQGCSTTACALGCSVK